MKYKLTSMGLIKTVLDSNVTKLIYHFRETTSDLF